MDIIKDVTEFFPEGETGKLRQAGQSGAIVGIDLVKFKVYEVKAGRVAPVAILKNRESGVTVVEPD